ncbi:CLIP-associating protein 1-B [Lamellibrachia satsuma]|nr:CLIP-associating protein 1-B [Lamellibrachia satsuma]
MEKNLDYYAPSVCTPDSKKRLQVYMELANYLRDSKSALYCDNLDKFIEGLVSWVTSSNYKISVNGLEVLCLMIDRFQDKFRNHVTTVLPAAVDRLGDAKVQVRDQAAETILKLMVPASHPQYVIERIGNAFTHKLWRVREEILGILQRALMQYGAKNVTLSKLVPTLCKMLDDPSIPVRDAAVNTLAEIYRHVGERVRYDLQKKELNPSRLNQVFQKMDDIRDSGDMVICEGKDETDFVKPVGVPRAAAKRIGSSSSSAPSSASGARRPIVGQRPSVRSASVKRRRSVVSQGSIQTVNCELPGGSGAIDEEGFANSYEDVPKVHLFSGRELTDHMGRIHDCLCDPNIAWEKRVEALKTIRSLLVAGATDYDEFHPLLRKLEPTLQTSLKDLRSQVVREACITASFLSKMLGNRFDHCAEMLLPTLIVLIQNSAKIMASSGLVTLNLIIQQTHSARLIPLLTCHLSSKSSIIRRECSALLDHLLRTWPTHTLERHIPVIQEAIKRQLSDPDTNARAHARKAFWAFADHFKDQAESLLNALDPAKQKMLQGEMSRSSSSTSLSSSTHSQGAAPQRVPTSKVKTTRTRSVSTDRGMGLYSRTLTGVPLSQRRGTSHKDSVNGHDATDGTSAGDGHRSMIRSSSAADLAGSVSTPGGAHRSTPASRVPQTQTNYSSLRFKNVRQMKSSQQQRRSCAAHSFDNDNNSPRDVNSPRRRFSSDSEAPVKPPSLPPSRGEETEKWLTQSCNENVFSTAMSAMRHRSRPQKKMAQSKVQSIFSPERSRSRSKIGMSQSQPSSRSGSPSSRLSYLTHVKTHTGTVPAGRVRRKSGIPCSQGSSRDTSPVRTNGRERRLSASSAARQAPLSRLIGQTKVAMAQRVLTPGGDMEAAVADALRVSARRRCESAESDDAGSETSSICSERSFSSFSRTSEASDFGERKLSLRIHKDVAEMLGNLGSASWADRKEGLNELQNLLHSQRCLNRVELKKVTDIFTRMFHDPHGKVFSLFLDTLVDLVVTHHADLCDWLHVCLTRLLTKMGADIFGSVHTKVLRALDVVREYFPYDWQFNILIKFSVDQTQSPSLKVKVALLNYIHSLTLLMEPQHFVNSSDMRLSVSRFITWTTEPKSAEVRKAAQTVLIGLFNLNPPDFSTMLAALPKTFQEGATKILHNHLRSYSQDMSEPLTPRNAISPPAGHANRYRSSPARAMDEVDTENMNPEEIYNSFKKTSADIQSLSKLGSHFDEVRKERESTSQDSGIQDLRGSPDNMGHKRRLQYNPSHYQEEGVNGYNKSAMQEAVFDVESELFNEDQDQADLIQDILAELSNHNERHEERIQAMQQLMKMTRDNCAAIWDDHFKTILLLLLETLGDNDGHTRSLSLRALKELLKYQPCRFTDYAELTIMKVLDAHKDPVKEVTRAAEECATTLVNSIPPEQCARILTPIIMTGDFPVTLAAIKMQTKVIEALPGDAVSQMVPDIVPGLLKGYDSVESSVRKASVFCLVSLHMSAGADRLKPYLIDLNDSKTKLLNLYIKRAMASRREQAADSNTDGTSPAMTSSGYHIG